MKHWLILLVFLAAFNSTSQTYNSLSVDGNFGFTSALGPFADGYKSNYLGLYHADANIRYMLSNKFGVMWGLGFDRIKNDELGYHQNSLPFKVHVIKTSFQMVFNVGRIAEFEKIHKNFGMLIHGGFGFGSLKSANNSVWFKDWKTQGTDEMMHVMFGFTTQYRLTDYIALHMDITYVENLWQSHTWDYTIHDLNHNLDGRLSNFSVGASYYFGREGKGRKHLDWTWDSGTDGGSGLKPGDTIITKETIRTIETIRIIEDTASTSNNLKDKTPDGHGPDEDFDGDGIINSEDACPTTPGDDPNGCPNADSDGDGIANTIDDCPDVKGTAESGGCPPLSVETKRVLNEAMREVNFELGTDILQDESKLYLNKIIQILNDHPEYLLTIEGHTDNSGEHGPNMSLSTARAESAKDYLVSMGIDEARLAYEGYGETKPIASNDSPSGRKQNMRVEFTIRFQ